jgi:hypothetical protein
MQTLYVCNDDKTTPTPPKTSLHIPFVSLQDQTTNTYVCTGPIIAHNHSRHQPRRPPASRQVPVRIVHSLKVLPRQQILDPLLDHGDLGLEAPRQLANDLGRELGMGEFLALSALRPRLVFYPAHR